MYQLINDETCTLLDCPPGLFLYKNKLCFKAKYESSTLAFRYETFYTTAYYIDGGVFLVNLLRTEKGIYSRDHKQVIPVKVKRR